MQNDPACAGSSQKDSLPSVRCLNLVCKEEDWQSSRLPEAATQRIEFRTIEGVLKTSEKYVSPAWFHLTCAAGGVFGQETPALSSELLEEMCQQDTCCRL